MPTCYQCLYQFKSDYTLKHHLESGTCKGLKGYNIFCEYCKKTFKTKNGLYKHKCDDKTQREQTIRIQHAIAQFYASKVINRETINEIEYVLNKTTGATKELISNILNQEDTQNIIKMIELVDTSDVHWFSEVQRKVQENAQKRAELLEVQEKQKDSEIVNIPKQELILFQNKLDIPNNTPTQELLLFQNKLDTPNNLPQIRFIPKILDKGNELFKSIKKFAMGLPSYDPLNTDLNTKNICMTLLSKCGSTRDLTDFGNYALRLAQENRNKSLNSTTAYDRKHLRNIVWENQFGEVVNAKCPLCNKTHLKWYSSDWEVGHIISKKDGGALIEVNLRPICKSCNIMVGSESLYLYARTISGALERLKLIDFLKEVPEGDPTRFSEILNKEQLKIRMELLEKKYELENNEIRKQLLADRETLNKQMALYKEELRKEFMKDSESKDKVAKIPEKLVDKNTSIGLTKPNNTLLKVIKPFLGHKRV